MQVQEKKKKRRPGWKDGPHGKSKCVCNLDKFWLQISQKGYQNVSLSHLINNLSNNNNLHFRTQMPSVDLKALSKHQHTSPGKTILCFLPRENQGRRSRKKGELQTVPGDVSEMRAESALKGRPHRGKHQSSQGRMKCYWGRLSSYFDIFKSHPYLV